jgi:ABC-type uncharacterized transport system substrate-binding protein
MLPLAKGATDAIRSIETARIHHAGRGAAAWPLAASAQQSERRMRHIGVLSNVPQDTPQGGQEASALQKGLQERGWTAGQNIRIEFHSIEEKGREQTAKDLVGARPDVIVCSTSPTTAAVLQLTRSIPIVFVNVTEPAAQVSCQATLALAGISQGSATLSAQWGANG